jgi:hypothetical protein
MAERVKEIQMVQVQVRAAAAVAAQEVRLMGRLVIVL